MSLTVKDIDEIGFQRKEWRLERIGWGLIALMILAALLGVFGIGPVSETVAGGPDEGVEVRYERFNRHIGTTEMHIAVPSSSVENQKAEVFISNGLLEGLRIESVHPQPDTVTSTAAGSTYEFAAENGSSPLIEIVYRPDEIGVAEGTIRAGTTGGADVWMLTYP